MRAGRAAILLLAVVLSVGVSSLVACGEDDDRPPPKAATGGTLFTQSTAGGSLRPKGADTFELILRNPARRVTAFSDRPSRRAASEPLSDFVDRWAQRGFQNDPPNAALVVDDAPDDKDSMVLELSDPRLGPDAGTLRYTAKRVGGRSAPALSGLSSDRNTSVAETFGRAQLFIDAGAGDGIRPLSLQYSRIPQEASVKLTFDDPATVVLTPQPQETQFQGGTTFTLTTNSVEIDGASGDLGEVFVWIAGTSRPGPINGTAEVPSGTRVNANVDRTPAGSIDDGPFSIGR